MTSARCARQSLEERESARARALRAEMALNRIPWDMNWDYLQVCALRGMIIHPRTPTPSLGPSDLSTGCADPPMALKSERLKELVNQWVFAYSAFPRQCLYVINCQCLRVLLCTRAFFCFLFCMTLLQIAKAKEICEGERKCT